MNNKLFKISEILELAIFKMESLEDWVNGIPTNPTWADILLKQIPSFNKELSSVFEEQLKAYQDRVNSYIPKISSTDPIEVTAFNYDEFIRQYIINDTDNWKEILSGMYKALTINIATEVITNLEDNFHYNVEFNTFNEAVSRFLEDKSMKWATQVQGTTEKSIKDALIEGYESGKSFTRIAESLVNITGFSQYRAETIARTEVLSASNYADFMYNMNCGVYYAKRWRTSSDEKVRQTHKMAEGQVVLIEKPFEVGGFLLMFPTDTQFGASAKEIINCRCGVEYLTKQEYDNSII